MAAGETATTMPQEDEMKDVIDAFNQAANTTRADLFDDNRLMPITATADANTAACGWVGENWERGGDLMIGINPGGGGDGYRRNPTDDKLYGLIRAFRDAAPDQRDVTFSQMSSGWIDFQRSHSIWRLVGALFDATGQTTEHSAFVNVLPFRTRNDNPASIGTLLRSVDRVLMPQLDALAPKRIFALGLKTHKLLLRLGDLGGAEVIALPRTIGDSYIAPKTASILKLLKEGRMRAV